VRFGRDYPFHHVDRAREVMTARAAHAAGFGPAVEYAAPGVMVTAFIGARTWGADDLRANPERVARCCAASTEGCPRMSGAAFLFWPFHVIRDYARTLRRGSPMPTCPPSGLSARWRRRRSPAHRLRPP
jgi:hypothetical protein